MASVDCLAFKLGHSRFQFRPLGVKTGQYRRPVGTVRDMMRGITQVPRASGDCILAAWGSMNIQTRFAIVTLLVLLTGCGPSEQQQAKRPQTPAEKGESAKYQMLSDANRSNESYLQQLHSSMKVSDGFLTIEGIILPGVVVLPSNSGWTVSCGISGLAVAFGGSVSGNVDGGSGSTENDAKVDLSLIPLSLERCREIAPQIGREVRAILAAQ